MEMRAASDPGGQGELPSLVKWDDTSGFFSSFILRPAKLRPQSLKRISRFAWKGPEGFEKFPNVGLEIVAAEARTKQLGIALAANTPSKLTVDLTSPIAPGATCTSWQNRQRRSYRPYHPTPKMSTVGSCTGFTAVAGTRLSCGTLCFWDALSTNLFHQAPEEVLLHARSSRKRVRQAVHLWPLLLNTGTFRRQPPAGRLTFWLPNELSHVRRKRGETHTREF